MLFWAIKLLLSMSQKKNYIFHKSLINLSSNINLYVKILTIIVVIFWIIQIIQYQINLFGTGFLVELAENESLVLSNVPNSVMLSLKDLVSIGVLPIYPDFYYRLAMMLGSDGSLEGLRLISFLSFWISVISLFFIAFLKTKNIVLAMLLSVIIFGKFYYITYFNMARVDSLMLAMSLLTILFFEFSRQSKSTSYLSIGLAALFGTLAIATKQTAIVIFISWYCVSFVSSLDKKQWLINFLSFIILSIICCYFYFYKFSIWGLDGFFIGLNLYGANFNPIHAVKTLYSFLLDYWFFFFILVIQIFHMFNSKSPLFLLDRFNLIILFIPTLFIIKVLSNSAAYGNNFIFLSFFYFSLFISFYKYFENIKINNVVLIILILGTFANMVSFQKSDFSSSVDIKQIKSIGKITDTKISKAISGSNRVLSFRNDNYLIYSGINVEFEGSVLVPYFMQGQKLSSKYEHVHKNIKAKLLRIRKSILNKEFDFIIVGIGNTGLGLFPEIKLNYSKVLYGYNGLGFEKHYVSLWKRL